MSSTIKVSVLKPSSMPHLHTHNRIATLYKSLGIDSHTILALAAVYGTVAFIFNCLTTKYLTDQWGRRKYIIPKTDQQYSGISS